MKKTNFHLLRRFFSGAIAFVFLITNLQLPFAYAATAEELLADPSRVDPFTTDVPKLRENFFETLHHQEKAIIQKHVQETGIPWTDSAGEIYTHHPRYEQAVKEYNQVWQQHMEQVRRFDAAIRERGMTQVLDRARELAKKDGVTINWSEEFRSSGTDPWKGRGVYTDAEYTGTDRANRYVRQALQEKNMTVTATPGQNSTKVKQWDLQLWGEEGKGKIHRAFEAENREFAKTAMSGDQAGPVNKQAAALDALKKAHLDERPAPPGSWQEYQRMNDLVKAVERGEQNVLGKKPKNPEIQELNKVRSMEIDPVTGGLRKLGDERGLQNPMYKEFEQKQMQRLSDILKEGENANKTFIADIDKKIQIAETQGNAALANELKTFKNQSLQQQILQRKALVNQLGQQKFAETVENTQFELVRDPDAGQTMVFRNKETGKALTKLEMMEKYRSIVNDLEKNQAAGKELKYRNLATNELISQKDLLERSKAILKNLEEGKYVEAMKLTEYEPMFQRGKVVPTVKGEYVEISRRGPDGHYMLRNIKTGEEVTASELRNQPLVKKLEYEVVFEKGTGGQRMYRNVKTGEMITEAEMQKRYVKNPIEDLRKQMSDLGAKEGKASFSEDAFSFKGVDEKAFKSLKTIELPKVKENILPPSRAKNIKLVYKYAKLAEKYFKNKYPKLGSQPNGAFWLADPAEAIEEYLLEAERKMSQHPDILKAFRAAKKDILRQYVRTQLQHQKDAVMIAQEEYIKAAKERTILRVRKMAQDAEFNQALQNMMFTLLVASKLVDFMQTWYDEGFDALARKAKVFLAVEIPVGLVVAKGFSLLIPYLAMNSPKLYTVVQGVLAYGGAVAVGAMVFTIAGGISYMTTDYFILDENRQTLIRSLCPFPPKRTNLWDIWTWLAEKRHIDVEKDFTPILDPLTDPSTSWTTSVQHIQEYAAQLVTMYRHWLTNNYDYVRRLRYFEDDPKVWSVITGELAKRIWLVNKAEEFKEAQEEESRAQKEMEDAFFNEPPQEIPEERQAVIYEVAVNGQPIASYFSDFKAWSDYVHKAVTPPVKLKAGSDMKVHIGYAILALPKDVLKVRINSSYEEGYGIASGEEASLRSGSVVEEKVTADEEFGIVLGAAEFSLPLQYPSEKQNNSEELFHSTLKFLLNVEEKNLFSATVNNAFTVEGPGTDFNGKGNLKVTVKADKATLKDVPIGDLPDVTVKLEPLSGQTEVPQPVKGMYLNGAHTFENLQLGQWRVIAELEKKEIEKTETPPAPSSGQSGKDGNIYTVAKLFWNVEEAYAAEYAGPGKGEKLVTMFMPRPMKAETPLEKRHAGDFKVEVELGKFDLKDFIKIKRKQTDLTSWNILVTVQDMSGKPVIGAEVVTLDGNRSKATEIGQGQYIFRKLSAAGTGTVRVGAEIHAQLMRAVGTHRYFGETTATFNNASQENVTIVIPNLAQHKWLIRGTARYSDGTSVSLQPGDEFTITMGGEEQSEKKVSGLSYSFGPFSVPPDSGAENPAIDTNNRGLRAEIRRGGKMIAVASGTVVRKGLELTEYDIPFAASLKNIIEPQKKTPRFISPAPQTTPSQASNQTSVQVSPPMPKVQPVPQATLPVAKPPVFISPASTSKPVHPAQPAGNNDCVDADGRPTLFCKTFN
ncbi:MAG TPA: hypothetical protein PLO78_04585 [Candidatus Omnitrophota bacterium]|nr:hypothetical protein [Candidatus Omnitrophota bacterium]